MPLDREAAAAAADDDDDETLLVCSTDDPWGPPPVARRIGEATIDVPIVGLDNAGHVNPPDGFGPRPLLEASALGERARPV